MKKSFYLVISLLIFTSESAIAQKTLNAMTFNIRLSIPEKDSLNNWQNRKEKVASQILFHETDIVGVQEARPNQMVDLQGLLPSYQYAGVAREPNEWGEFSAIFYNTNRLQLLEQNTFWLSENITHVGEKGWDAACPRIVTYAYFKDKKTKKTFYVFNTHFDHMGKIARRESAKLLLQKVNEISQNTPTIIMGDFNAKPNDEPIQIITEKSNSLHLIDSKNISLFAHYGPTGTFNGFQAKEESNEPIDYIFIKNKVKIVQHATLSQTWNGHFSSDHFPVFVKLEIEK